MDAYESAYLVERLLPKFSGPILDLWQIEMITKSLSQSEHFQSGWSQNGKAMKSSPLLGPFCGSEFWGFSLLKI